MAGYSAKYSEVGANLWLDMWADVSVFRDAFLAVSSGALVHVGINSVLVTTREERRTKGFCIANDELGVALAIVVFAFTVASIVSQARVDWGLVKTSRPLGDACRCRTPAVCAFYAFQVVYDVYCVFAGALLQMAVKPSSWYGSIAMGDAGDAPYGSFVPTFVSTFLSSLPVELRPPGLSAVGTHSCTLEDAPLALLVFVVGEVMAFGAGIRLFLLIFAVSNPSSVLWAGTTRIVLLLLAVAASIGLGMLAAIVTEPLKTILTIYMSL